MGEVTRAEKMLEGVPWRFIDGLGTLVSKKDAAALITAAIADERARIVAWLYLDKDWHLAGEFDRAAEAIKRGEHSPDPTAEGVKE